MMRIILLMIVLTLPVIPLQSQEEGYRVVQERKVTHDIDDEQLVIYRVIDSDDREIYSVTREVTYDAAFPSAGVFDSGNLVIVDSFNGTVEFYNTGGELIESAALPEAADVEHERKVDIAFHRERVAFAVSEPGYDYIRFAIYRENGQQLVYETIDAQHGSGLVYAGDGSLIALGTYSWIGKSLEKKSIFITDDGMVEGNIDVGFEKGSFSGDGSAFMGFSNSQVHLIDTREFELLWSHEIDRDKMIIEAKWNTEDVVVLSSNKPSLYEGEWRYEHPIVQTIEKDEGNIISEQQFPGVTFTSGSFRVIESEINLLLDKEIYRIDRNE